MAKFKYYVSIIATGFALGSCITSPVTPPQDRISQAIIACTGDIQSNVAGTLAGSIQRNVDKLSGSLSLEASNAVKSDFVNKVLDSNMKSEHKLQLIEEFNNKRLPCLQKHLPPLENGTSQNIEKLTAHCNDLMTGNISANRSSTYAIRDIQSKSRRESGGTTIYLWGIAQEFGGGSSRAVAFKCVTEHGEIVEHEPIKQIDIP